MTAIITVGVKIACEDDVTGWKESIAAAVECLGPVLGVRVELRDRPVQLRINEYDYRLSQQH